MFKGEREDYGRNYQLILRNDENDIEVWIGDCNCGYSETGPSNTKEVLQILGIKIDYSLINTNDKLKLRDIVPHHDLNFVIFEPKDRLQNEVEKRIKIQMEFKTAHEKWDAKVAMSHLGFINPLDLYDRERREEFYFRHLPYSTEQEWAEYKTNNALTLNSAYKDLDDENLIDVLEHIGYRYNAEFEIKSYEKL